MGFRSAFTITPIPGSEKPAAADLFAKLGLSEYTISCGMSCRYHTISCGSSADDTAAVAVSVSAADFFIVSADVMYRFL